MHISLKAENIFEIGAWPISNTLLLSIIIIAVFFILAYTLKTKISLVPNLAQATLEIVIEGMIKIMEPVLGTKKQAEKYLPFVATIFFLVLFSNWIGLVPGIGSVLIKTEEGEVPLFRAPSSDLNFTLALAITTVIAINIFAVKKLGLVGHLRKFINFKNPLNFFVGILELISEFAKIISFSFRLFGNIFAGEVLLLVIAFLIPYIAPLPFLFLEIFVGFIQALVFAMLTLVFIAIATAEGSH